MTSILLYSSSFSQSGTATPSDTDGSGGKGLISGSSSLFGSLNINAIDPTTGSFSLFLSGSDSASLYLYTYASDNTNRLIDNVFSGSAKALNFSVSILY